MNSFKQRFTLVQIFSFPSNQYAKRCTICTVVGCHSDGCHRCCRVDLRTRDSYQLRHLSVDDDVILTKVLLGGRVDHQQRDAVFHRLDTTERLVMAFMKHISTIYLHDTISRLQTYNVSYVNVLFTSFDLLKSNFN